MFASRLVRAAGSKNRSAGRKSALVRAARRRSPLLDALEPRLLFSESASATLSLVSTTGTQVTPIYNYSIKVTDTGTTPIGTFWFGWIPGADFLPTAPSTESSPTGWGAALTGSNNQSDGTAIQWTTTTNAITPGQSRSGFDFSSTDSPTVLAGQSPSHPSSAILTSFVYAGGPLSDAGFQFNVTSDAGLAATTTSLQISAAAVQSGDPVTLTSTVAPASGHGATPSGTVTFLQNGGLLGTVDVQHGGTASLTTSSLLSGTSSITAQYSGDTTYSASTSAAQTETVTGGASTLVGTLSGKVPPSAIAGQKVSINESLAVVDPSNVITGTVSAELFLSTSNSVDNNSIAIGPASVSGTIKPHHHLAFKFKVSSLPAGVATGTYHLVARITDPSTATADAASIGTIAIAPPQIDLSGVFAKQPIVGKGGKTPLSFTVTNHGNIPAVGPLAFNIESSPDGLLSDATPLFAPSKGINLKPGKAAKISLTETLPSGSYFLLIQLDPADKFNDISLGNNVFATGSQITV